MASQFVYVTSDGGGVSGGSRARALHTWIRAQKNASLIVYGGDVYNRGEQKEFADFLEQMGGDLRLYCATPGNHEWKNRSHKTKPDAYPVGFEEFWAQYPPPLSRQPIDQVKKAGARYEHFIDVNGWRFVFLDTGALDYLPSWPMDNPERLTWLRDVLREPPGRSKIVIGHHSRLQWGRHRDAAGLQEMWEALFDEDGTPRAAFTLGGHNHNVSIYDFRDAKLKPTDEAHGIQLWVNGAGGVGSDDREHGTPADLYPRSGSDTDDPPLYAVTQIEIHDATRATARLISLGQRPHVQVQEKLIWEQVFHA